MKKIEQDIKYGQFWIDLWIKIVWVWVRMKSKIRKYLLMLGVWLCAREGFSVVQIVTIAGTDYIRYRDGSLRSLGKVSTRVKK